MKRIYWLSVVALALLVLAGALIAVSAVDAGGGGGSGQCGFAFVRLGCEPRVICENPLATPELDWREDGWHIYCRYDPQAPQPADGDPLVIDLGVGELAHVLCETRLHFDLFNGEQGLEVLCEE